MELLQRRLIRFVLALAAVVLVPLPLMSPFATAQEPLPDLTISGSAEPNPVPNNSALTYTMVVSNIGDAPAGPAATPIEVSVVFHSDFSLELFEVTPAVPCIAPGGGLVCEITTLGQGESVTITASGTVSTEHDIVGIAALVDLPVSHFAELVETLNNIALIETIVLQPKPVGGVSVDLGTGIAQLDAPAAASEGKRHVVWAASAITFAMLVAAAWIARRRFLR